MSFDGLLPPWRRPDNFGLSAHQRVVDRINQWSTLSPTGETEIMSAPSGSGIIDRRATRPTLLPWVTISATESGLGMYAGYELTLSTTPIDPAADVTLAMIGTAKTELILIMNEKERGSTASGPFLSAGGAYPATWSPARSTDGRRVAIIREDDPDICED